MRTDTGDQLVELKTQPQLRDWQDFQLSGMPHLISAMHLCQAVHALAETGLLAELRAGLRREDVDALSGFDIELVRGLLRYLVVRGVVDDLPDGYRLSRRGELLTTEVSLARLGVYAGAYGTVTARMGDLLTGKARYDVDVHRDGGALGRHCATLFSVFHSDTIRTATRERGIRTLLDAGCGGGQLLIDACRRDGQLTGIGLDNSAEAIAVAEKLAREHGVADRIQFFVADAFAPETWPEVCRTADAMCIVSALHEHFRHGEAAVAELLRSYARSLPDLTMLLVGEPELLYEDRENHDDFLLIHVLTGQGLPRDRNAWLPVFAQAGLPCRHIYLRPGAGPRLCFYDLDPTSPRE
ncbi:SAM-dependent methyltransferase [Couchioplanes caeruleus]|uniref:Methyltransferase n=2 Tax=Couchioplanes caeruleus TaxID=56438 RepID=A0A1K0GEJ4_9ACTN|nr:class I SAM-dependent methyltransferase [Couchioplanes caeruleus]OJF15642.1 methyltransferase [Couchioplanes caeruleus subsp. caeruleus]ROP33822.1 methyltransferase family protein [Couchioplanes caeruleus]